MDTNLLMSFEPEPNRNPILKPSLEDNFILLQTPVQKNLKVRFQTPARTPLSVIQPLNFCELSPEPTESQNVDDAASWKERIEVVTKFDHEEYMNSAKLFIEEIIERVVARSNRFEQSQMLSEDKSRFGFDNSGEQVPTLPTCGIFNKENVQPNEASAFKSKKTSSKTVESVKAERPPSESSVSSTGTVFTANSFIRGPVDEQPSITEVYIEHCSPTLVNKSSPLKTIYSIFDAGELPEDLQGEAAKASQLYSKKNPAQDSQIKSIKTSSATPGSPQKSNSDNVYSTKKLTAGRNSAKENPPSEPRKPHATVNSSKHFTSAEVHFTQSQSTVGDEEFQDAHSLIDRGFDFDLNYLESKGNEKVTKELRKQSLYLKFDPLVAGEIPINAKHKVGRKSDIIDLSGRVGLPHFTEEPARKVVDAAVQPDLLCASPETVAKTSAQIQCNIVKQPTKSLASQESWVSLNPADSTRQEIIELLKYTEADLENAKKPLKKQISFLKEEVESYKEKISQMQVVLQEFESTVLEMAEKYDEEKGRLEKEKSELSAEQTKTISHLESVEKAYLELLQRSEQMKVGIGNYKVNEETYKNVISEYQSAQEEANQRYKALKTTMEETQDTDSFGRLNNEITAERKEFRSQTTALKARCKCLENQAKSLQLQLDQKTNENSELTKICDELIEQQQAASLGGIRD